MESVSDITCTRNILFAEKFIRIRYNLPESAPRRKQFRLIYARRVFARCSDNFLLVEVLSGRTVNFIRPRRRIMEILPEKVQSAVRPS
jgi:hypothetical protein